MKLGADFLTESLELLCCDLRIPASDRVELGKVLSDHIGPVLDKPGKVYPASKRGSEAARVVITVMHTCLVIIRGALHKSPFTLYQHDALEASLLGQIHGNSRAVKATANDDRILSAIQV
ncbi:hypothetical protein D3C81_1613980 [compost metagenome]